MNFTPVAALFLTAAGMVTAGNAVSLEKSSFAFPGDGVRNLNKRIGLFCCAGQTATVRTTVGVPIGYIYFFDVDDTISIGNGRSAARNINLRVSGAANLSASRTTQVKATIGFTAGESKVGDVKSVEAGNLKFTATLVGAELAPGANQRFDREQIAIQVEVEVLRTSAADSGGPPQ